MASLTDDNEAGGNLDKRNIWLIGVGHTSAGKAAPVDRKGNPQRDGHLCIFHPWQPGQRALPEGYSVSSARLGMCNNLLYLVKVQTIF